ncbi:DNA starvation/stationary phase protection protein [Companilactobacillus sp. DQM5]|uniref:DNA starvation/stationary phase protection protein n=1 Tax=Companilactobacillus sp. DQM5 TaxID=3463359 RepID=UPI004058714E
MKNINQLYEQEIRQSEIDHKLPTAGAMTGHIVSNLQILEQKIQQVKWYYVGINKIEFNQHLNEMILNIVSFKDKLGSVLLDELELVPSTSKEFQEYTMLKEDSKAKYLSNTQMINMIAEDIQTNTMFITRAIKLSEKENLFGLKHVLIDILEYNNREFRILKGLNDITIVDLREEIDED